MKKNKRIIKTKSREAVTSKSKGYAATWEHLDFGFFKVNVLSLKLGKWVHVCPL